MTNCLACGVELIQPKTGRRRLYCSHRCREVAYRVRHGVSSQPDLPVPLTPRVASQRYPVTSFATFSDLDAWLEENL